MPVSSEIPSCLGAWTALGVSLPVLFLHSSDGRFYAQSATLTPGRARLAPARRLLHHPALPFHFHRGHFMSKQINWYYFRKG
jgi:hypothetical protein